MQLDLRACIASKIFLDLGGGNCLKDTREKKAHILAVKNLCQLVG